MEEELKKRKREESERRQIRQEEVAKSQEPSQADAQTRRTGIDID